MDDENSLDEAVTWVIVGSVGGFIFAMVVGLYICLYWQRHSNNFRALLLGVPFLRKYLVTRRDSLDDLEDEGVTATHSQKLRQWRRHRETTVVGVKSEKIITKSGTSGFRWKKKWRDRKARSKAKRKEKHEERKKRRAARAAKEQQEEEESEEDSDDDDDESSS